MYRCENIGYALAAQGHDVTFAHLTRLEWPTVPQVALFHRPMASFRLWHVLRWLRRRGVVILADFDDLIMDEAATGFSPGVMNDQVSRSVTRMRFTRHRWALNWFDGITVSTQPLAERVRRLSAAVQVMVIPNCVHRDWRRLQQQPSHPAREKVITYFPGTRSHNRDFQQIRAPLTRFLLDHPEFKLQITGLLAFDLSECAAQVTYQDRIPFAEFRAQIQRGWVNLAPLEATPFNQCKSALKVIESGYWGIPTIISPLPDAERFRAAGALIARDAAAWTDHLVRMLDVREYRRITHGLRERVLAQADIDTEAENLLNFACSLKRVS